MLNIEQELELGPNPGPYELKKLRLDGDIIIAAEVWRNGSIYDYNWRFNAKTGVLVGHENNDRPTRLRPKSKTLPVTHFDIHAGGKEWPKDSWIRITSERYDNGKEASARAKHHNALSSTSLSPFRFMVKKEVEVSEIRDYPGWAEFRFSSGEWTKLPWADEEWAQGKHPVHFAHLSLADNCQVAFWPNEAAAQTENISVMSPGRYLQQYFSDVLSPTEIRNWAVKVDVDAVLKFATTEDEIYDIYGRGPDSCMRYRDDQHCYEGVPWRPGFSAVRCYGAGDLALAYLERKGRIIARALCWPEKKVAGRRYGDIERLTDFLIADGYTIDQEDSSACGRGSGGFNGARLKKIVPPGITSENVFACPYIDGGYSVRIEGEFLVMDRHGDICATRTDGLCGEPTRGELLECDRINRERLGWEPERNEFICDECDDSFDECDRYDWGDSSYCQSCINDVTFICARCSEREDADEATTIGRQRWCSHCTENYSTSCGRCTTRVASGETLTVNDDEEWCQGCYELHSHRCDLCEESFSSTQPVYDARDDSIDADVCDSCIESADTIQRDNQGRWINTETATHCGECGTYFDGNLEPSDCPTCQQREAA